MFVLWLTVSYLKKAVLPQNQQKQPNFLSSCMASSYLECLLVGNPLCAISVELLLNYFHFIVCMCVCVCEGFYVRLPAFVWRVK